MYQCINVYKDKLNFLHQFRTHIWKNPYQCTQYGFEGNKKNSLLEYCKPNNSEMTNVKL